MNKRQLILVTMMGASIVAGFRATAQVNNYNDNDLLLNFRNSLDDGGNDAEVDLGNVSTFISAVTALPSGTAVLDSGTGYNTSSYAPQFSGAGLIDQVGNSLGDSDGSSDNIGFSAAAENLGATGSAANTLWLTRVIAAGDVQTGGTPSVQNTLTFQNRAAANVQLVGYEGESPANGGTGTAFTGAIDGGVVTDSDPYSYHTLAKSPSSPDVVNYDGYVAGTTASPLEGTPSSGTVYEALWEVPVAGNGSAIYLGYFAFETNGELDFTVASAAKPPPPQVSLTIIQSAPASAQVLWPTNGNFTLQQNTSVTQPTGWTTSGYTVSTSNGTNSVTISPLTGNLFFRLSSP